MAIAVFIGTHLEHSEAVRLSSDLSVAMRRVPVIVQRALDQFGVNTVALESPSGRPERRAATLQEALTHQLRTAAVAVWPVGFADLCRHSSLPPVRTRNALRQITTGIFPALKTTSGGGLDSDAALLGLYVQIERVLALIPS